MRQPPNQYLPFVQTKDFVFLSFSSNFIKFTNLLKYSTDFFLLHKLRNLILIYTLLFAIFCSPFLKPSTPHCREKHLFFFSSKFIYFPALKVMTSWKMFFFSCLSKYRFKEVRYQTNLVVRIFYFPSSLGWNVAIAAGWNVQKKHIFHYFSPFFDAQ